MVLIDGSILPLMGFCYMLQFMDKVSLGYSTQLGLIKDLVSLVTIVYSGPNLLFWQAPAWVKLLLGIFSLLLRLSHLVLAELISLCTIPTWEIPSNISCALGCHSHVPRCYNKLRWFDMCAVLPRCQRSRGGTWLFTSDGHVLQTQGTAISVSFLRANPGPIVVLTSCSMGIWFAGNGIANIFSGVIAYGIGKISSPLAAWRILFLILGGMTAAYGIVLLVLLPDSPNRAKFLTPEERTLVIHRTTENKTGVLDEGKFNTSQMWEAFRDPQAWLLVLYTFVVNIPNGGITSVRETTLHSGWN